MWIAATRATGAALLSTGASLSPFSRPRVRLPPMTSTDPADLQGRVAIITGATAGIGAAVARALAAEGAAVVLAARREDRLEAETRRLTDQGCRALAVRADVTDMADMRALADATLAEFDRIDILVNNAGVLLASPFTDANVEEWTRMVQVNVNGVLHGVGAVLPAMLEQGGGHIVNLGSVAGRRPFTGASVYAATKFAVRALSWGMHLDLGQAHGIRVTDIQPGFVSTEILGSLPGEARTEWERSWEGLRPLKVEDIARAVVFAVTAPEHVSVSEVLIRPLDQPA